MTSDEAYWYLDSSALVKLVVDEPESTALRSFLAEVEATAASALVFTEVPRATDRHGPSSRGLVDRVLASLTTIVEVDRQLLDAAAAVPPVVLRSLDAIHLASAERFGTTLDGLITYDRRLAESAEGLGLTVVSPGR